MKRVMKRFPGRSGLWLFLGLLGAFPAARSQNCMRWVQRLDVGHPGPQSRHCMTYDRDAGVTLLFGAELETAQPYFEFDPQAPGVPHLVPSSPTSIPRGRVYHDMVYDEHRGVTMMVGGMSDAASPAGSPALFETWELRPLLDLSRPSKAPPTYLGWAPRPSPAVPALP